MVFTGCQISEALALRYCDVDIDNAYFRFKTLKRRREVCAREYEPEFGGWPFLDRRPGRELSTLEDEYLRIPKQPNFSPALDWCQSFDRIKI